MHSSLRNNIRVRSALHLPDKFLSKTDNSIAGK